MSAQAADTSYSDILALGDEITELAGHLNAVQHRWLTLIARFDSIQGWAQYSYQSCAHWLNWQCGLDMGAARERIRVAHALESLPKISAAMAKGEISYSKVRAMTRIADEQNEDFLLMIAHHGTAKHVETTVRQYRRAKEAAELTREANQYANRTVDCFHDTGGSLVIKARLPAEVGAVLLKALDAAIEQMDVSAETRKNQPNYCARRADALGLLAETFLEHGTEPLNTADRHQIVVHVDAETLKNSVPGRCELEDGPSMAAETARRLSCDASVVAIIENENGEPLNVGRKTRTVPPAMRRALNARDQGCRFPGCCNKRYVDAHHIHHWALGGETKTRNLVTLCKFHHRAVHEGNIKIEMLDDGALRFIRPDGTSLDSLVPGNMQTPSDGKQLTLINKENDICIDKSTAATRWGGEHMDYGMAVQILFEQARGARGVSAETPLNNSWFGRFLPSPIRLRLNEGAPCELTHPADAAGLAFRTWRIEVENKGQNTFQCLAKLESIERTDGKAYQNSFLPIGLATQHQQGEGRQADPFNLRPGEQKFIEVASLNESDPRSEIELHYETNSYPQVIPRGSYRIGIGVFGARKPRRISCRLYVDARGRLRLCREA